MTVDRKFTSFTVRHEIHRLFRLYLQVNQYLRTESCTAGHRVCIVIYSTQATEYVLLFTVLRHEDEEMK